MTQQVLDGSVTLRGLNKSYGDVIVHIFAEEMREFYEIERLYTDVPVVEWH